MLSLCQAILKGLSEKVNIGLGNELFEPIMTQIFDAIWQNQAIMR